MDFVVGFRFYPTDEEIIRLLKQKRLDPDFSVQAISETNIYDFEPFELPSLSRIQSDEKWCNFFCAPDYINADTKRVSRATKTGYWKVTGEVRKIKAKRSKEVIGSKRILVFYERPGGSKEIKTNWVMHQFSVDDDPLYKKDFVVYRMKRKRDKKRHVSTNVAVQPKKKPRISTRNKGEPSHRIAYDNGNPVEDNAYPESQLPSNSLVSNPGNCVVENTSPQLQSHVAENNSPESQLPPSNSSASNPRYQVTESTLQVDPQNLAKSNILNECNGLDHTSPLVLQSPINPEQGPSYSSASSNDHDVSNSPFGDKREDNSVNRRQCFQNEYPCGDTGDSALPPYFNSIESVAGFCSGVSSELDTETFGEWVNGLFEYNS